MLKITKSKNKTAPNFIYKGKKYKIYVWAYDSNNIELCLCEKDKHGNLQGVKAFNITKQIEALTND